MSSTFPTEKSSSIIVEGLSATVVVAVVVVVVVAVVSRVSGVLGLRPLLRLLSPIVFCCEKNNNLYYVMYQLVLGLYEMVHLLRKKRTGLREEQGERQNGKGGGN